MSVGFLHTIQSSLSLSQPSFRQDLNNNSIIEGQKDTNSSITARIEANNEKAKEEGQQTRKADEKEMQTMLERKASTRTKLIETEGEVVESKSSTASGKKESLATPAPNPEKETTSEKLYEMSPEDAQIKREMEEAFQEKSRQERELASQIAQESKEAQAKQQAMIEAESQAKREREAAQAQAEAISLRKEHVKQEAEVSRLEKKAKAKQDAINQADKKEREKIETKITEAAIKEEKSSDSNGNSAAAIAKKAASQSNDQPSAVEQAVLKSEQRRLQQQLESERFDTQKVAHDAEAADVGVSEEEKQILTDKFAEAVDLEKRETGVEKYNISGNDDKRTLQRADLEPIKEVDNAAKPIVKKPVQKTSIPIEAKTHQESKNIAEKPKEHRENELTNFDLMKEQMRFKDQMSNSQNDAKRLEIIAEKSQKADTKMSSDDSKFKQQPDFN